MNQKLFLGRKENINMNFISGNIKGNICKDDLYFNKNTKISSFNFLLVYESNIDIEIDGILGLSKGSFNKKNSFLNQLKNKNIIKHILILYDLHNRSFYIDEIPQMYLDQKSISCKDNEINSHLWKCDLNYVVIDNIPIMIENEIIFDSGTNGIIFPIKYEETFQNICKNNLILQKGECKLEYIYEDKAYQIICNKTLEYNDINNTEVILEFFLDKGQNNSFSMKLSDLISEDFKSFYLFIFERKKEILLGSPFFEKYPVLFNFDDNVINILLEEYI